jgi:alpha-beta hydrolase superfamily lysophospholipase
MHPTTALHILPVPRSFAKLGFHVLCGQNRYVRNDTALIFEKVLLDYGAFVRHAKERLGYEKVVLCGWSGGAALTMLWFLLLARDGARPMGDEPLPAN